VFGVEKISENKRKNQKKTLGKQKKHKRSFYKFLFKYFIRREGCMGTAKRPHFLLKTPFHREGCMGTAKRPH